MQDGSYYSVKLQGSPCHFNNYDTNGDGLITKVELFDIFGTDRTTVALFNGLNDMKGF